MQLPNNPIIRHNHMVLPRDWSTHPEYKDVIFDCEIKVTRESRLRAKVLVFKDRKAMRQFWTKALGRPELTRDTAAVCNTLASVTTFSKQKGKSQRPPERRVDPRYFCVLGFVDGSLTPEFITHESVHAAYAYDRRVRGKNNWPDKEEPEESICYPAGRIAGQIIRKFHKEGLFRAK